MKSLFLLTYIILLIPIFHCEHFINIEMNETILGSNTTCALFQKEEKSNTTTISHYLFRKAVCAPDEKCFYRYSNPLGRIYKCTKLHILKDIGEPCKNHTNCTTENCEKGFCAINSSCLADFHCGTGKFCNVTSCKNRSNEGGYCANNNECLSGLFCAKKKCMKYYSIEKGESWNLTDKFCKNGWSENDVCVEFKEVSKCDKENKCKIRYDNGNSLGEIDGDCIKSIYNETVCDFLLDYKIIQKIKGAYEKIDYYKLNNKDSEVDVYLNNAKFAEYEVVYENAYELFRSGIIDDEGNKVKVFEEEYEYFWRLIAGYPFEEKK